MIVTASDVKAWAQQYLAGKISKQELAKWAYKTSSCIFNEGIYQLNYISLINAIDTLSEVDTMDPCT